MPTPNYLLLYVDSPEKSGRFYARLLGREPVEASPTFVLFVLETGLKLGLWSRHTVEPGATAAGGGAEIGIGVESREAVDALYREWKALDIPFLQEPTELDFGRTFVGLDPDGHRLRVLFVDEPA